jgi:phosphatidylserine/phosphatidylglycerophosphate/cardiolipin synthase-like enzyme
MKSKTSIPKCFLAKDVFSTWKKVVAGSQHSITIFTPYFDSTIGTLLKSCTLPKDRVKIITVFDPETLLRLIQQLKASQSLIEADFKLFHLPELHAKILVSDQSKVVLGSQNFTRRGRKKKMPGI